MPAEKGTEAEAAAMSELLRDSAGLPVASRPTLQDSLIAYTNDVVDDEFPRMRQGETIEQQSDHLTEVWQSFLEVQPVSQREIAGSLLAFVLYLTFATEHPFVGSIAVSSEAYQHVLDTWSQLAAK